MRVPAHKSTVTPRYGDAALVSMVLEVLPSLAGQVGWVLVVVMVVMVQTRKKRTP